MFWASPPAPAQAPFNAQPFNTKHLPPPFAAARWKLPPALTSPDIDIQIAGMPKAAPHALDAKTQAESIAGLLGLVESAVKPGMAAAATSVTVTAGSHAAHEVHLEDQALLMQAVASRLRAASEAGLHPTLLHELMTDGARALDRLLSQVLQAHTENVGLRAELQAVRRALGEARHELIGTQAGERRARHMAQHDDLTSLPNSGYFRTHLADALGADAQHAPTLALLYLDLDGFKPINDRYGHATGDELLRIVAQRLRRSIRAEDMVCRLGGDEFACLLSQPMGREQLSQLATKLFDAIAAPLNVGGLELSVRPSIGIAICPTDGNTPSTLLKRADTAMYRAKRRQLGYAFFDRRSDL
jgi:diguanylate cyclase (GGDEF)-like protein